MWDVITGKIENETYLHLGTGKKTGNFHPTHKFIPGRALRGMVGNYLYENDNELFKQSNISSDFPQEAKIFFHSALPTGAVTIPQSIRVCKKCKKVVESHVCPECKHETSADSGFAKLASLKEGNKLEKINVKTTITTHAPIGRKTHTTSEEGMKLKPYNVESIISGTRFDFKIICDNSLTEKIIDLLPYAGEYYGLGGFRSKGFGTIKFLEIQVEPLETFVEKVNVGAEMVANSDIIFSAGENGNVIGFKGDVVLKYIKDAYKIAMNKDLSLNKVSIIKQYFREGLVKGWTNKGKSQVDTLEPSTIRGSTCMIELPDEIKQILAVVGLGERIHAGYGNVYFWR